MKLISNISHLRGQFKNPVLTIGNFDGVHLGHQGIIKQVVRQAKRLKGTSIVVTFNLHPLKALRGTSATSLITTLEHRLDLIRQLGVDACLLLDFNKQFSLTSAENFIKHKLIERIGIKYLIISRGFRFGRDRRGDLALLKELAVKYHFKVRQIKPVSRGGRIVSSSRIRILIKAGKISQVSKLLGRMFCLSGKVNAGSARGRILGFPTANIIPAQEIIPSSGVYAVYVKLGQRIYSGILNIGFRPTFNRAEGSPRSIEVHIFHFCRNIYNRRLEIFFVQRIRAEKRFSSHQALITQIKKDQLKTESILQRNRKSFPKHSLI